MNFEEFLENGSRKTEQRPENGLSAEETVAGEEAEAVEELDVQKAVVEELAADKAQQDEVIDRMKDKLAALEKELSDCRAKNAALIKENEKLSAGFQAAEKEKADLVSAREAAERKAADLLEKRFDEQSRNPNALALLDRETELPDRFPGETRDHVLEVIREARDRAEEEGRIRKAQLLEGVLVANEPHGNLAKKRAALEKFFNDNANILSGPVIVELERCGISYKKGEEYLLTNEILKRTY